VTKPKPGAFFWVKIAETDHWEIGQLGEADPDVIYIISMEGQPRMDLKDADLGPRINPPGLGTGRRS
jgi:hypothetical protein